MTDFKQLPVYKHRQMILDALKDNQVIIVESPTGSGKTYLAKTIARMLDWCVRKKTRI